MFVNCPESPLGEMGSIQVKQTNKDSQMASLHQSSKTVPGLPISNMDLFVLILTHYTSFIILSILFQS